MNSMLQALMPALGLYPSLGEAVLRRILNTNNIKRKDNEGFAGNCS
jgi:hypothetical protein